MNLLKFYLEDFKDESDSEFFVVDKNDDTVGTLLSQSASGPVNTKASRCTSKGTNVVSGCNGINEYQHREEGNALIQSILDWVDKCVPSDEWQMPHEWLAESDELRQVADKRVRQRNPNLRIWRTGRDKLICKAWLGPEPPPNKTYNGKSRFRRLNSKRIETMWSETHGWCRWDTLKHDYVPGKKSSEKLESTENPN
jgi:hypothetical protein